VNDCDAEALGELGQCHAALLEQAVDVHARWIGGSTIRGRLLVGAQSVCGSGEQRDPCAAAAAEAQRAAHNG
jgi:hypothetical protein